MMGALILVTLAAYARVPFFDFVSLDDPTLITENPNVQTFSFASVRNAFTTFDPELYIPLTILSYQLEHLLVGNDPALYHITNLLLHLANSLLVCSVIVLLTKKRGLGFVVAIFFAIHPLHAETVAWVSARKDLLSAFFGLLTLHAYMQPEKSRIRRLSLVFFVLGLLSKVSIAPLPLMLLLADGVRNGKITKEDFLSKIGYFGASAIFIVIALLGKGSIAATVPPLTVMLVGAKAISFYALKTVFPADLRVLYVQETAVELTAAFAGFALIALLMIAATAVLWRKNERMIAWGMTLFMLMVMPSFLNILKNGTIYYASDRYAYLASIGLLLSCLEIGRRVILLVKMPTSATALIIGVNSIALLIMTMIQASVWTNSFTLFTRALTYHPDSVVALDNRGMALVRHGYYQEALTDFRRAAEVRPDNVRRHLRLGEASIWAADFSSAKNAYLKAISLSPYRADAHFGLGLVFTSEGDKENATAAFRNAMLIDPDYVQAKLAELGASLPATE